MSGVPGAFIVGHLIVGPAEHGVVRFAESLAVELGGPVLRLGDPLTPTGPVDAGVLARADVVLMQYTDGLYGRDTASAAAGFVRLREQLTVPVAVTLHDLPDPGDEAARYGRRSAGYRAVAESVDAVVVSSRHEAGLFGQLPGSARGSLVRGVVVGPGVVPLPIDRLPTVRSASGAAEVYVREVAVLGFVYPGKGHDDALAALETLPSEIGFTAIGRAADGHDDLVRDLTDAAERFGRLFRITGFVPDAELMARLRRVAVPIAPSRAISASGSINTWLSAGRRPLVAAGPYTRELAARCPGAVHLYEPGELPDLIRAALADPPLTWLDDDAPIGPDGAEAAAAYRELLARVVETAGPSGAAGLAGVATTRVSS